MIRTYVPIATAEFEAALLTNDNLEEVANWCGGWLAGGRRELVGFRQYKWGDPRFNQLQPVKYAYVGEYIYKKGGAFFIMSAADFEARYQLLFRSSPDG